jgi:hypothetical protein
MVHVNDDGSRIFIPYLGGLGRYIEFCRTVAQRDYEGFLLTPRGGMAAQSAVLAVEA